MYIFMNPVNSFQELKLAEAIVNRLQTVGLRFCGAADHTLSRLRGALPAGIIDVVSFTFFDGFYFVH